MLSQPEVTTSLFDNDVIALLFQGHYYGVLSLHPRCFTWPGFGGIHSILASDEAVPIVMAAHACFACGKPLLSPAECAAVVRLREELHLAGRPVPVPLFRWQQEHNQYEAQVDGILRTVSYALMANTMYKCLRSGLDTRRAFDASEWEVRPNGRLRFAVLKKKKG